LLLIPAPFFPEALMIMHENERYFPSIATNAIILAIIDQFSSELYFLIHEANLFVPMGS
jgi:hypothetical protein